MLNDIMQDPAQGWSVIGHEMLVSLLKETLVNPENAGAKDTGNAARRSIGPRHAYLLTGARHIGKTTLANDYAKGLLCSGRMDDEQSDMLYGPCNSCRSCHLVDSGNHPDLRKVQPTNRDGESDRNSGILRVEQAGQIIHEAALSPLESRYKCFIIQDIHKANASFANKLLKTLEEPPAHVILLLTATDRSSLLPTIVSRCQLLELRQLAHALIASTMVERWGVEQEKAKLLARLSNGRMGWAIGQIDNEKMGQWRLEQLEKLRDLINSDRVYRLAYVDSMTTKRNQDELVNILELWTIWWRDIMLAQSGCLDACINVDLQREIEKLANVLKPLTVKRYVRTLRQIEDYLRHTTNLRLALDVLLLELPSAKY